MKKKGGKIQRTRWRKSSREESEKRVKLRERENPRERVRDIGV